MRVWMIAVLACGCLEPDLVRCPQEGLLCRAGDVCDAVHHICITPQQAIVCVGQPDSTPCGTGFGDGLCGGEICLPAGCGNGIVDPSEACDDGNRANGDGCNEVCRSREICGDAYVDSAVGETCDDGNGVARDGCDSRCAVEHVEWTVEGVAPSDSQPGHGAYDAAHHRAVHIDTGLTWSWDGAGWHLLSFEGPARLSWAQYVVIYDPVRERLVLLGGDDQRFALDRVWELDGTTWTQRTSSGAPQNVYLRGATYDAVGQRIIVLALAGLDNSPQAFSIDPATMTWTTLPSPGAAQNSSAAIAYDANRGVTVVTLGETTITTCELAGTSWSCAATAKACSGFATLVYEPALAAVISVGGGSTRCDAVERWTGTAWVAAGPPLPSPRSSQEVIEDVDTGIRIVLGSAGFSSDELLTFAAGTWAVPKRRAPRVSFGGGVIAYDPGRHQLIRADPGDVEVWGWTGTWHQIAALPAVPFVRALAYDPVRDGVVVSGEQQGTWILRDDQWTAIESPGPGSGHDFASLTYDPSRDGIIGMNVSPYETMLLPSNGTSWVSLGAPLVAGGGTSAFDARNQRLLQTGYNNVIYELIGTTWEPTLSPGGGSVSIAADQARGSVVFETSSGKVWERSGAIWAESSAMPLPVQGPAVYAPDVGELLILGTLVGSRSELLLHRTWTSGAAIERCEPGADDDGDGLARCDDPDCWWSCTPACPPYTSCP